MAEYRLHFEWPGGAAQAGEQGCNLDSDSFEQAKLKAAILYVGASFDGGVPTAYRIAAPSGQVLYRFPQARRTFSTVSGPGDDDPDQ